MVQFSFDVQWKEMWIRLISWVDASGQKWELLLHDCICWAHLLADAHPTFRDAKKRSNDAMSRPASYREARAAKRVWNRANQEEVEDAASIS